MDSELMYKRLGHLGEVHLVKSGADKTMCGNFSNGPNFSEVAPVTLEPRPDPTLCVDCKEAFDAENKEEEPAKDE